MQPLARARLQLERLRKLIKAVHLDPVKPASIMYIRICRKELLKHIRARVTL
jgi:hypothetical protein